MVNAYGIRKYAALLLMGMFPTIGFVTGSMFYGFIGGLGFFAAILLTMLLVSVLLLKSPFTQMLEGKGILCQDLTSTGLLKPFIVSVIPPKIYGKVHGKEIEDVFDREAVIMLNDPVKAKLPVLTLPNGDIIIRLTKEDYHNSRFQLNQYPTIFFNSYLGSVLTKRMISDLEKDTFIEHSVIYLNQKMQELTSVTRDFARYIVETLKPKESIFSSKWTWVIIGIVIIIFLAMFAPSIIDALKGTGSNAVNAVAGAKTPITPRG